MANNKKKSSTSKYQKKAVKTVKKAAKKNPKVFIIIVLVLALLIGAGLAVYFFVLKDKIGPKGDSSEPTTSQTSSAHSHDDHYDPKITTPTGMSINFLEFGNHNTGDCTFIKAGDVDILIDAGSKNTNVDTLKTFINKYCEDGKLEYVIATHGHEDHIAGFYDESGRTGIFNTYKIGTLIDFSYTTNDMTKTTTKVGKYARDRKARIESKDIEHHYTAKDCITGENGGQKEFTINDSLKMTILDQKFYYVEPDPENPKKDKEGHTLDENNYSVCALFSHGENHYLFTGDLEKEGEESLVELNELPHVQLFKGGHHGSKTSNTETLLSKITPEVVCICCCAGNDEYTSNVDNQFPTQTAINNIAKYTTNVFVTTVTTDGHTGFTSMNGNICFKSEDGKTYTVAGSNNSTILKETEWFKNNRTWPTA